MYGPPWWLSGKESTYHCQETQVCLIIRLGRSPRERNSNDTLIFLTRKSHGERSLVGYSPWGHRRLRHDLVTKQQQIYMVHIYTQNRVLFNLKKEGNLAMCNNMEEPGRQYTGSHIKINTIWYHVLSLVAQSYLTLQPHGLEPTRFLCPW